jgi:hypothetical protein
MGPERIELSAKERERLKILQQVEEGHLKAVISVPVRVLRGSSRTSLAKIFASRDIARNSSVMNTCAKMMGTPSPTKGKYISKRLRGFALASRVLR